MFSVSASSVSKKVALGGNLAFASDTLKITVEQGPAIKIENPFNPQGVGTIIPFSSGTQYAIDKNPMGAGRHTIATIGFGSGQNFVAANDPIKLPIPLVTSADVTHTAFSMPSDGTVTGLSAFFTAVAGGLLSQKTIITAELYQSTTPDNTFDPVPGAKVVFDPIDGIPALGETRNGIVAGLKILVKANTRLLLVFYCDSPWSGVISITGYMSGGLRIQ